MTALCRAELLAALRFACEWQALFAPLRACLAWFPRAGGPLPSVSPVCYKSQRSDCEGLSRSLIAPVDRCSLRPSTVRSLGCATPLGAPLPRPALISVFAAVCLSSLASAARCAPRRSAPSPRFARYLRCCVPLIARFLRSSRRSTLRSIASLSGLVVKNP